MVAASQVAEPKFRLKYPADTINRVLVDGEQVDFLTSDDGDFIILDLDPKKPVKVTIVYEIPEEESTM